MKKKEHKMNKYMKQLAHHFEGCELKAYLDTGGVPTIGWGTTYYSDGDKVAMGDIITHAYADQEFDLAVEKFTRQVKKLVEVPLTEYQEGALIDLAYNIGINNFKKSTLLKLVNSRDFEGAAQEFKWWRKDNGKVIEGLVRRRLSEENLFRGDTVNFIIEKLPENWRSFYYNGK
jgi:lysozyme